MALLIYDGIKGSSFAYCEEHDVMFLFGALVVVMVCLCTALVVVMVCLCTKLWGVSRGFAGCSGARLLIFFGDIFHLYG